ncbi:MAG: lipopolysaccharide biosynthesis protein [Anaerolineae bacterium]|nr:lipopolysaccharide biosynthesis protein [Anaerolineae bacterium]
MTDHNKSSFNKSIIHGAFWTYNTFYGGKLLVFVSTIILARLLTKEDFGVVGYALLILSFLGVMEDLGIGKALIYHRDDPEAAHTAFWLGLATGIALFFATWFIAPLAAVFFNDERIIPITRVLGLTFPIFALGNVHSSLLEKDLQFKHTFGPEVAKMGGKGIISILFALLNFGAWSLAFGQLTGSLISTIVYWRVLPWRPAFRFSRRHVKPLLSYGGSLVLVGAMAMISTNADYLFVGRYLGAAALGVYTLAYRIPEMVILQISKVVARVLFPAYTKIRDDSKALQEAFLSTIRYISLITVPLGVGMALVAEPMVLTLFTEKWAEAIPVVRAISIYTLLFSLAANAGSVHKAQGRTMLMTKLAGLRTIVLLPALWWTTHGPMAGIAAVGWAQAIIALFSATLNLVVAAQMINVPLMVVAETIWPSAISSAVMALAIVAMLFVTASMPVFVQLIAAVLVGMLVYAFVIAWLQQQLVIKMSRTVRAVLLRGGN